MVPGGAATRRCEGRARAGLRVTGEGRRQGRRENPRSFPKTRRQILPGPAPQGEGRVYSSSGMRSFSWSPRLMHLPAQHSRHHCHGSAQLGGRRGPNHGESPVALDAPPAPGDRVLLPLAARGVHHPGPRPQTSQVVVPAVDEVPGAKSPVGTTGHSRTRRGGSNSGMSASRKHPNIGSSSLSPVWCVCTAHWGAHLAGSDASPQKGA